ncbi:MAG: hypothetical protein WCJ56_05430 [bacterium]
MKKYLSLLGPLALLLFTLAGCGGGGDTPPADNVLKTSADGKIALVGAEAALPTGVTPANITLVPHTAAEVTAAPAGATFAAAVECGPSGTVFSSPVTLRFTLAAPPAAGENLVLYMLVDDDSNPATPDVWQMIGGGVTVDGNVVSVQVTHFSTFGLFVTANAVLPADKYFRFDTGVYNGGMPSHIMYNDIDGTLSLPHAQLLPLNQSYESISNAPYGDYKDSNGPTGYYPAATTGAVFAARVPPLGAGESTYYKLQIISHTLHGTGSTDYGNVTFKYARILAPAIVVIDGEYSFASPSGATLSIMNGGTSYDLRPTATSLYFVTGSFTAADTLVGNWTPNVGSDSGTVIATFAKVDGKLNATFVCTGSLGTVTLVGGTKAP